MAAAPIDPKVEPRIDQPAVAAPGRSNRRPSHDEPKTEPGAELKAEPKAEPKTELKAEPKTELKAEPRAEPKIAPHAVKPAVGTEEPKLRKKVGRLELVVTGAKSTRILVDGAPSGAVRELAPGTHTVQVSAPGMKPQTFTIQIEAGKTHAKKSPLEPDKPRPKNI